MASFVQRKISLQNRVLDSSSRETSASLQSKQLVETFDPAVQEGELEFDDQGVAVADVELNGVNPRTVVHYLVVQSSERASILQRKKSDVLIYYNLLVLKGLL